MRLLVTLPQRERRVDMLIAHLRARPGLRGAAAQAVVVGECVRAERGELGKGPGPDAKDLVVEHLVAEDLARKPVPLHLVLFRRPSQVVVPHNYFARNYFFRSYHGAVGDGRRGEDGASTAPPQAGRERPAPRDEPCSGTTLVGLVLETAGGLRRLLDPRIEDQLGVGGQSFEILLRLSRSEDGRLRMSDLAAQTGITRSGLTHALDRLDEAGLVRREACSSDRRGMFALLTSCGNERMAVARAQHERDVAELLDEVLTDDDTAALAGLLRRLRDRVNAGALSGSGEEPVVTPLGSGQRDHG